MGNLVLYPHMCNFAYGDRRMHMGIPVCKRAGIAEKFAYGDPITHNEIVRIWGLTYICWLQNREIYITGTAPYSTGTGYSTSTVRLQFWYCPTFFVDPLCSIFLSVYATYVRWMFPDRLFC